MIRFFLATLLFSSIAINAALMLFFAGVYRKMMDASDSATFKSQTELLVCFSSKSSFMIVVLNLPLLVAVPYYYVCGLGSWLVTVGLLLWLISGSVAKVMKLPVYKRIAVVKDEDTAALNELRKKLNNGNRFQAWLYVLATAVVGVGIY